MDTHTPVLMEEVINSLCINPYGTYVDTTFGYGGHSRKILSLLNSKGKLIASDRDSESIYYGSKYFNKDNFTITNLRFSEFKTFCCEQNLIGKVDGILCDLGLSSVQLDSVCRGFSFLRDGPLDMRMDRSRGVSAQDVLNTHSDKELAFIFKNFGEERHSKRIAKEIKNYLNNIGVIDTTLKLANLICKTIGKREKKHPATRCFLALRIYVNRELDELKILLNDAMDILKVGGRLSIISFHSIEDRMVKNFMKVKTSNGIFLPRYLPVPNDWDESNKCSWVIKKCKPNNKEIISNTRSRSAILRTIKKLHD